MIISIAYSDLKKYHISLSDKNYRSKQKPFFSLFHKQLLACKKQTIAIKSESFHLKLRELYVQSCFLSKLYFLHFSIDCENGTIVFSIVYFKD